MFCKARALLTALVCCTAGIVSRGAEPVALPPAATRKVEFAADIRPLLSRSCFSCHGPDKQKGDLRLDHKETAMRGGGSGPAIVPGRSTESLLVQAVSGARGDDLKMPQKGEPLTPAEIGLLRAWIDQGAIWPEEAGAESSLNHWAFQPLARPALPPTTAGARTSSNPIDRFIQAKLAAKNLSPSPEADRRMLIRRLYFDLTGLPPSPKEMNALSADRSESGYERLVDQLLSSSHYGERWARYWLDVVRYAETYGFEMNQPRPNAWPYRDYVIQAFNDDKPYDQFVQEQLAGDALGAGEATGFLVAGASDQVKSPDIVLTSNQRADELHDIISTTSSTFLGLTVGCARCHNHKFDPIPQTDYYAIKAVFEGVQHGEHPRNPELLAGREEKKKATEEYLAGIDRDLAAYEPLARCGPAINTNQLRIPVNARVNTERIQPVTAQYLRFTITATSGGEPCLDELEVYSTEGKNVALISAGTKSSASGTYPNSDIHKLAHLNDGRFGNSRSWISNEPGRGWVELDFAQPIEIERVVWGRDREQKYKDRLATAYRIEVKTPSGSWSTVASSADRRPYQANQSDEPDYATNSLSSSDLERLNDLLSQRKATVRLLNDLTVIPMVYAGDFQKPEQTYRFQRGDPMQKREPIKPGALSLIPVKFSRDRTNTDARPARMMTEDQERRLAFARWVVNPQNPLTARVIVNRVWQQHFGEGLVSTPSDFGLNGAKPSHPELLDWLAIDFMAHGWSLKYLHRLIVTSTTYRQSSAVNNPAAQKVDAGDRLLWRFPSRRLEAEVIRDSMLAVAGKLDLRMGGPGWSPFEPNENYVRVYVPKQKFGSDDLRRMIYATVVRQRPDGVFGVFDCPDGGQIAPKRTRSTTPLQALNLLNSGFMMQVADFFATRLQHEAGNDSRSQTRLAFNLAFGRPPTREELKKARSFIDSHGLKLFCRALFNANEFVYLF